MVDGSVQRGRPPPRRRRRGEATRAPSSAGRIGGRGVDGREQRRGVRRREPARTPSAPPGPAARPDRRTAGSSGCAGSPPGPARSHRPRRPAASPSRRPGVRPGRRRRRRRSTRCRPPAPHRRPPRSRPRSIPRRRSRPGVGDPPRSGVAPSANVQRSAGADSNRLAPARATRTATTRPGCAPAEARARSTTSRAPWRHWSSRPTALGLAPGPVARVTTTDRPCPPRRPGSRSPPTSTPHHEVRFGHASILPYEPGRPGRAGDGEGWTTGTPARVREGCGDAGRPRRRGTPRRRTPAGPGSAGS